MPDITPARFAAAYEFGKKIHAGQITEAQAVERLVAEHGMDAGSANGYVRQLEHFLNGVTYTRTINDPATRYYLENIAKDFGSAAVQTSLTALRGHIGYYEGKASKRPGLRAILLEFETKFGAQRSSLEIEANRQEASSKADKDQSSHFPTIFFNTAWMDHYKGKTEDDFPRDGGSWEEKHEVCNFLAVAGRCYGFVQPAGTTLAIERIGAGPSDDHIDGVTIVWSARSPSGRTVVVGFYRNARLYRNRQKLPKSSVHEANRLQDYFAVCREEDAILLSHKRRDIRIPRGIDAMGQSLVWYGDTARGLEEAQKVASLLAQLELARVEAERDAANVDASGATVGSFDPIQEELEEDVQAVLDSELTAFEKTALVKARIGQGKFRQQVMQMWRNGCAVTGCQIGPILRASHIKAWRDCANRQERLDPDNGLMLSANLDALFDRGLISFAESGNMLVASDISDVDRKRLGLGLPLTIRPSQGQSRYLKHHRKTNGFA